LGGRAFSEVTIVREDGQRLAGSYRREEDSTTKHAEPGSAQGAAGSVFDVAAGDGAPAGEAERRSRLLVDSIQHYAIFALDAQGRIASWNAGATQVTGFLFDDVVGRPSACLYSLEDVAAGKSTALLNVASARGRIEDEGWWVRKDGSRFWAEVTTTTIADPSGALTGYAVIARDGTERLQLEQNLVDAHDRMRALMAHLERSTEQQRMALAREIHDVLGQELTGLRLDSAWLSRRIARMSDDGRQPILERLETMATQIDSSIQTVRRIASGLRPGVLDDLGLVAAIEWQAREFEGRASIKVELALPEDEWKIDRERATTIFRIFQELITNVARHAGASGVSVLLARNAPGIVLEISDDGRGITAGEESRPDALGILGMRERAAQFGGSLEFAPGERRGTRATLRIPV